MAPTSRSLIAAAACLLVLTACGDDSGSDEQATDGGSTPTAATSPTPSESPTDEPVPSSSASAIEGPNCAAVWVAGETLPRSYRGCVDDDGAWEKAERKPCSFGVPIVTYADRYYAVVGKVVNDVGDLKSSKEYRQALSSCQA